MLRSYFEADEIIYLFRSSNGKRFSMKDIMMFIFGFIFGIFTIISIILSFFFTIKLLLAALISFVLSSFMFGFYFYNNRSYFSKNEELDIEYAITNKRFIICDKIGKRVFHFPITAYYKVFAREKQTKSSTANIVLRVNTNIYSHIPFHMNNEDLEITSDGIVIYNVQDAFLLEYQLKFLFYVNSMKIKDIYNSESFLGHNEHIVYSQDFKKNPPKNKLNLLYMFFVTFPLIYIGGGIYHHYFGLPLILQMLGSVLSMVYLILILHKWHIAKSFQYHKNNFINLKYVITNRRILFFDYANLLLYAFKFDELDFVNLSNYNSFNDTGDIFLSNYKHHYLVESEISSSFGKHSTSVKDDSYDLLFPPNYLNHTITFNFDIMNCSKIRLYGIKNPRSVIDNFIMKHVKDHETIKKHY